MTVMAGRDPHDGLQGGGGGVHNYYTIPDASSSVVVTHSARPAFDRGALGGKAHAQGAAIRFSASP